MLKKIVSKRFTGMVVIYACRVIPVEHFNSKVVYTLFAWAASAKNTSDIDSASGILNWTAFTWTSRKNISSLISAVWISRPLVTETLQRLSLKLQSDSGRRASLYISIFDVRTVTSVSWTIHFSLSETTEDGISTISDYKIQIRHDKSHNWAQMQS